MAKVAGDLNDRSLDAVVLDLGLDFGAVGNGDGDVAARGSAQAACASGHQGNGLAVEP